VWLAPQALQVKVVVDLAIGCSALWIRFLRL